MRDHVNNLTYLLWCLRSAEEHWRQVATPEMLKAYMWYVLHHSIDYKAAAFLGERLEVQTWVPQMIGAKCDRHYKIIRLADNKVLVKAKTVWCLIDSITAKPTKITDEIRTLFVH